MSAGSVFNMREIRESLALAEQLAKASMNRSTKNPIFDANNNEETKVYVPPKQLLLYLVRMGSFTSAPKVMNGDHQDDDIDIDGDLRQICEQELSSQNWPPLIQRPFVPVQNKASNADPSSIRVLQWNVLSQALGQYNDRFVSCPESALEWPIRRYRMLQEICEYQPDIICLQEVDHFKFLSRALKSQGYSGHFFPKPDSPCIYLKGNNGPDGCAVFFKDSLFELVKVETRIVEVWRVQSNQVVILAILRHKTTGQELCVVTTHLKARQGALLSTLRNEQGKDLLDFISLHAHNRPVLVCGDFNAEPSEPVYATMTSHPELRLESAYAQINGQEPPYTTWKVREEGEVCHTIDYVFYTPSHLQVDKLLQFPTDEQIGKGRVPSLAYASDHFSLVVDVRLQPVTKPESSQVALGKLLCV